MWNKGEQKREQKRDRRENRRENRKESRRETGGQHEAKNEGKQGEHRKENSEHMCGMKTASLSSLPPLCLTNNVVSIPSVLTSC